MDYKIYVKGIKDLTMEVNNLTETDPQAASKFVIDAANDESNKSLYRKLVEVQNYLSELSGNPKRTEGVEAGEFGKVLADIDAGRIFKTFIKYYEKFVEYAKYVEDRMKRNPDDKPELKWSNLGNQYLSFLEAKMQAKKLLNRFVKREVTRYMAFEKTCPLLMNEMKFAYEEKNK